jgi:trimethylamine--corrinoid protein Co-methyltransferase
MGREATRRRSGGRAGKSARRGPAVIEQMPWRLPQNLDRPTEPLDEAGVAAIHDVAMRILEEVGIEMFHADAIEILRKQGAIIEGEKVRIGRDFIMEMIARGPSNGR